MGSTQQDSLNMKVPQGALEAAAETSRLILEVLGSNGVDISRPDTPEGRRQFMAELKDKKIEIQKILHADSPEGSGITILMDGQVIGFVQAVVSDGLII